MGIEEREGREGREGKAAQVDGPNITLEHPAFDCITYKDNIVDGDLEISGNVITASFILGTGETRQETITI